MLVLLEGLEATTPLGFQIGYTGTEIVRILKKTFMETITKERMNTSFSFKAIFRRCDND